MTGTAPDNFPRRLLCMLSGPLIWFAHFSFLYAIAAFGGKFDLATEDIRALSWVVTAIACSGAAAIFWRMPRGSITGGLAFLSLIAIGFELLVLTAFPP